MPRLSQLYSQRKQLRASNLKPAELGGLILLAGVLWENSEEVTDHRISALHPLAAIGWRRSNVLCESNDRQKPLNISFYRKWLHRIGIWDLPLPRRVSSGSLTLSNRLIRQREADNRRIQELQQEISQRKSLDKIEAAKLIQRLHDILYGSGITPRDRQEFLETYGCTGWTPETLQNIVQCVGDRGIIEIGAGHGQWARALQKEYESDGDSRWDDYILAYDNFQNLPLRHPQWNVFGVQHCDDNLSCLRQWQNRNRVLLLVYPPPGAMAAQTLQTYLETYDSVASQQNTTPMLIYVGEGRGGSNGDDAFFNLLESGNWVLEQVLPAKAFGTKGYEKVYVLTR